MAMSRNADMFPALGAGKLEGGVDNQLRQAPEEEGAFDIWNDETFGDIGDADYDWEDEHERLAEELEGSSFFNSDDAFTDERGITFNRDSGFLTMDRGHPSVAQEDELEKSLNRLVVEDGEDRRHFDDYGQPIPGALRQSHLDSLFGPNSPPGYIGLETVRQKNIWGSPSTESTFQKPINNTLQAIFAQAKQAAFRDIPGVLPDPQAGQPIRQTATMPTLAEIENSMLARENNKPQVLTAEEVERQLRGDSPFLPDHKPQQFHATPIAVPSAGTSVVFRKPIDISSPKPHQVPHMTSPNFRNLESHPINMPAQPRPFQHPFHNQESPILAAASSSPVPRMNLPLSAQMAQSPRMVPLPLNGNAMYMANRMMGNALSRPPPPPHIHMPPPNMAPSFNSPYGSPSALSSPLRQKNPHEQYQQHNRSNQNNYQFNDGHFDNHRGSYSSGHFNRHHHHQEPYTSNVTGQESEDEYAGLMTKKEKDWIIRIQLIQLQTDNPYLDDYYFSYYTLKKKAADHNRNEGDAGTDNEPELLIPHMMRIEPRTYTPAQFEGSLGRLTAASVHNPRQIIDVCRTASPTDEDSGKKNVSRELRRYRQLLMDIEKGFTLILDIDDIEKKVLALPDENRMPLFEERLEKINAVYDYFMQDDSLKNFVATLQVKKGRKLLARLMPLLGKIQWLSMVTVLLSHLPVLIKKDTDEEGLQVLMPPLSRYLSRCDLECLVHFATILQKHPKQNEQGLLQLLHNSFGISLLCCLIKAGEEYFKTTSPVDIDNQLKTQWSHFIEEFVESLEETPAENMAWPDRHQPQVGDHVDRFVSNKVIGGVEGKLAHLSKPRPTCLQKDLNCDKVNAL